MLESLDVLDVLDVLSHAEAIGNPWCIAGSTKNGSSIDMSSKT
jgi:hypothetical protein